MLSPREQAIVIKSMKELKPTKMTFSDFDRDDNEIEILYSLEETSSILDLMGVIVYLEQQFNQRVYLTSFHCIPPAIKEDTLKEAQFFFDESKTTKANSATTGIS